jgi:hypothetical protein
LHGFSKGEAFGSDASGQASKYFAECFAPSFLEIALKLTNCCLPIPVESILVGLKLTAPA